MFDNTLRRCAVIAAAAVLCLVASHALADEPFVFPQTKAGEIAMAFFEAFNSGDTESFNAFTLKYRSTASQAKSPLDERVARAMAMREQVGELKPVLIKEQGDRYLVLVVHAEKVGMYLEQRLDMDEAEPDKLATMSMKPTGPPELSQSAIEEWTTLADLLEQVRESTGVPAIGAAIVEDGKVIEFAVVGVRRVGTDEACAEGDRFHIGSITKPVTATMIGRLVEAGKLDWDDTIGEALGDINMLDVYRDVTLVQLLQHRSGINAYTNFEDAEIDRLLKLEGSPTEQRRQFVAEVLMQEPVATPGTVMAYSNAGYSVVALMAERATGRSWEVLMRSEVFEPMGLTSATFGWPAQQAHQPSGHTREGEAYQVQTDEYELGAFLAPAGDVCMSVSDLAAFAQAHLDGLAGKDGTVRAATIRRLHALPEDAEGDGYACGWMAESDERGLVHWHNGSAGTFFALAELYPESNRALVVVVNVGLDGAGVADLVSEQINKRWMAK